MKTVTLCSDEIREREIQQAEWDASRPTGSLGELLRGQEIVRFNREMTAKYGHLRKIDQTA